MITVRTDPTLLDLLGVCINLPMDEREQYEALNGVPYDPDALAYEAWGWSGPRWAGYDSNGLPVVVGGLIRMRPGVFRTWFFATADAWSKYGRDVTRATRQIIAAALTESGGAHRIETVALASREAACRWYQALGLRQESTLKKYGVNGEDAVLFVGLRE